ncbi:MAG TPA: FxLYD domain-containing protein [Candidatus Binatia bacterium]|nr:FxLYD domain-containing protein [Candidatus Binatia bacterium]
MSSHVRRRRAVAVAVAVAVACALLAPPASPAGAEAGAPPAPELAIESAKWESGYGAKFFQVVGHVTNRSGEAIGAVKIQTELVDANGKVVAQTDCWNGRAEALADLTGPEARAKLASAKLEPIAPGGSDKWRCTILDEDAPPFESHRARVAETLPAP